MGGGGVADVGSVYCTTCNLHEAEILTYFYIFHKTLSAVKYKLGNETVFVLSLSLSVFASVSVQFVTAGLCVTFRCMG
jgi:hypothetical protein